MRYLRKTVFCVAVILLSSLQLFAGNMVIIDDDTEKVSLGRYLSILEDATGEMTISEVTSPGISRQFEESTTMNPSYGFTGSSFWVTFSVISKSKEGRDLFLELDYPLMDSIELHIFNGDSLIQKKTSGSLHPFSTRDRFHRNFIFKLSIDPGDSRTVFMRFKNKDRMEFPLKLWSARAFYKNVYREQYIVGMYYGILLVMMLFNFFLFVSVRDVSYLFYVLYILAMMVFQLGQNGYLYLALSFFRDPPPVHFITLTQAFLIIAILQFSQSYLNTRKHTLVLHRIFQVGKYISVLYLFFPLFLDYTLCIQVGVALAMCMIPLIIISGAVVMVKGYRPAYYFMAAWSVMFIAGIIFLLRVIAVIPHNTFTNYILHIGTSIEVVLLSLGLGDRYNLLKEERDRITNELKIAKKIHGSLLPEESPWLDGLTIHSEYIPAEEIGGDLFDYHVINLARMGVMISDVSGHGIPAALVASMVKVAFSLQVNHADNPRQVVEGMSRILRKELSGNFITASYTLIDSQKKVLVTANSGHLPFYIHRRSTNEIIEVFSRGSFISPLPMREPETHTVPLKSRDRIIIYTDGIIECRNRTGAFFGNDQLKNFIRMNSHLPPDDLSRKLMDTLERWKWSGASFDDDITLLVIDMA